VGYAEDYFAVVEAIKGRLATVAALKSTIFGEKESPAQVQFPAVFIIPGPDEISESTNVEFQHEYSFELVIVLKNYGIEAGLTEVISLASQCYDVIMADRQLGGTALWAKITSVDSGYGKSEGGPVLHWATINLTVAKVTY